MSAALRELMPERFVFEEEGCNAMRTATRFSWQEKIGGHSLHDLMKARKKVAVTVAKDNSTLQHQIKKWKFRFFVLRN